ncbi:Ig-like domain-containing protein [Candidatus Riflebacteria bacterium]
MSLRSSAVIRLSLPFSSTWPSFRFKRLPFSSQIGLLVVKGESSSWPSDSEFAAEIKAQGIHSKLIDFDTDEFELTISDSPSSTKSTYTIFTRFYNQGNTVGEVSKAVSFLYADFSSDSNYGITSSVSGDDVTISWYTNVGTSYARVNYGINNYDSSATGVTGFSDEEQYTYGTHKNTVVLENLASGTYQYKVAFGHPTLGTGESESGVYSFTVTVAGGGAASYTDTIATLTWPVVVTDVASDTLIEVSFLNNAVDPATVIASNLYLLNYDTFSYVTLNPADPQVNVGNTIATLTPNVNPELENGTLYGVYLDSNLLDVNSNSVITVNDPSYLIATFTTAGPRVLETIPWDGSDGQIGYNDSVYVLFDDALDFGALGADWLWVTPLGSSTQLPLLTGQPLYNDPYQCGFYTYSPIPATNSELEASFTSPLNSGFWYQGHIGQAIVDGNGLSNVPASFTFRVGGASITQIIGASDENFLSDVVVVYYDGSAGVINGGNFGAPNTQYLRIFFSENVDGIDAGPGPFATDTHNIALEYYDMFWPGWLQMTDDVSASVTSCINGSVTVKLDDIWDTMGGAGTGQPVRIYIGAPGMNPITSSVGGYQYYYASSSVNFIEVLMQGP